MTRPQEQIPWLSNKKESFKVLKTTKSKHFCLLHPSSACLPENCDSLKIFQLVVCFLSGSKLWRLRVVSCISQSFLAESLKLINNSNYFNLKTLFVHTNSSINSLFISNYSFEGKYIFKAVSWQVFLAYVLPIFSPQLFFLIWHLLGETSPGSLFAFYLQPIHGEDPIIQRLNYHLVAKV